MYSKINKIWFSPVTSITKSTIKGAIAGGFVGGSFGICAQLMFVPVGGIITMANYKDLQKTSNLWEDIFFFPITFAGCGIIGGALCGLSFRGSIIAYKFFRKSKTAFISNKK